MFKWHIKFRLFFIASRSRFFFLISLYYEALLGALIISSRFFFFFGFLGSHPWHMVIPRLGVKLDLQLPAYATATATPDSSHVCNLYHSSWQQWIPEPLSRARDRTCILMDSSQICLCCAIEGTPSSGFFMDIDSYWCWQIKTFLHFIF